MKNNKIVINYFYFGTLFLFLLILTVLNFLSIRQTNSSRFFFLIYALGQVVLELGLTIFLIHVAKKYLPRFFAPLLIGVYFLFFITHVLDFIMNRILDLSLWGTLGFVLDENFQNLIEMLHASGIPLIVWIIASAVFLITPFVGYLFYALCERLSKKMPIYLQEDKLFLSLFCLPIALIIWDISASRILNPNDYNTYVKSLPWNKTFLQPKSIWIATHHPPKAPKEEKQVLQAIDTIEYKVAHRPNIYLFIIESLREDFITKAIAPNLTLFKEENIHFDLSFSNGNGTHISWYSIFHSNFPFHWAKVRKSRWSAGSPALYLLRKQGYKIHVYTAAALAYYGMEELLFGKDKTLIDDFHAFPHYYPIQAYESDAKTIETFQNYVAENREKEGHVHIFFLDSTHFDYSWPEKTFTKFTPISADLSYFIARPQSNDLEKIKNRYRNAIFYVDSLFEKFVTTLKNHGLYDSSIIIFTGDHGEEFMEQGHMFHCSKLNREQTNVPLYYKFGRNNLRIPSNRKMTCHMEIFPSVFDYLFGDNLLEDLFEGSSIFNSSKWPFVFTSRYNASRCPYEFFIHNGKVKLIARFKNQKNIFSSKELQIIEIKDTEGNYIFQNPLKTREYVWSEFGEAFKKIFQPISKDAL